MIAPTRTWSRSGSSRLSKRRYLTLVVISCLAVLASPFLFFTVGTIVLVAQGCTSGACGWILMIPFLFVFAGLKYAFAIFISLLVALRTRVLRMNWLWALPAMLMALSAVQVQAPFWRYILSGPSIGGLLEIALPALVLGFFGLYTPPPVGANAEGARDRIARVVAATGLVWLSPAYLLSDLQGFPTDRFAGPFIDWLGHVRWYPLGALPPTLLVYAGFGYLLVRSFSDPGRARSLASPGMGRG